MEFVEDQIRTILSERYSECAYLDYKVIPHNKDHEFIKDIIAMLNSEEAAGKDKYIIIGVDNQTLFQRGINLSEWRDDNEWQNLIDKISPRPIVQTGVTDYDGKTFGYFFIPKDNIDWVYEVQKTVSSVEHGVENRKNTVFEGQAFTRVGSRTELLYDIGREKMHEKRVHIFDEEKATYEYYYDNNIVRVSSIVGQWNEEYEGDKKLISKLTFTSYQDFIAEIRSVRAKERKCYSLKEGIWRCNEHLELLCSLAEYFYDDDIDAFFDVIESVFLDADPRYGLPADKRFASNIIQKDLKKVYSLELLQGVAETIAILGNNQELFIHCTRRKITTKIYELERKIFEANDWRVFATLGNVFPHLGEACPDVFLKELRDRLVNKDASLLQFLGESEEFIVTTQYGYQLGWTLSRIAIKEEYFSRAIELLLYLSEVRDDFIDVLVGIVLPWYPQTHADVETRVGVFKGLIAENEELTWKALMKLMPAKTVTGNPVIKPKYLRVKDIPETVSRDDYIKASLGYIDLACEIIHGNLERMCEMISVLDDVPKEIQTKILDAIDKNTSYLDDIEKEKLWNVTQDFMLRHRKFSDTKWALSEDRLNEVDSFANNINLDPEKFFARRLFREDQYSLIEGKNYDEETREVHKKQISVIKNIYIDLGLDSVLKFVQEIDNKVVAGICSAEIISDVDLNHIFLHSKENVEDGYILGIATALPFERLMDVTTNCSDEQKALFLSKLVLSNKCMVEVEKMQPEAKEAFWKSTSAWIEQREAFSYLEKVVVSLNKVGRHEKSIEALYYCLHDGNKNISEQIVVDTLMNYSGNNNANQMSMYYIQSLIKWLQEKNIRSDFMIAIEWKYLAFLEDEAFQPKTIWKELSSNSSFFIDVLNLIYGDNGNEEQHVSEETIKQIASQGYRLLRSWNIVPGLLDDNTIDEKALDTWIKEVTRLSTTDKIKQVALNHFGRTAFHAPADSDGFFINRKVAKCLQNDRDGYMLDGYKQESINSRGVYTVDPTGKKELEIENNYLEKAKEAERNGMIRFAEALREIASWYHEDAIQNMEQDLILDSNPNIQ